MTQKPVTKVSIDFTDEKFVTAISLIKQPVVAMDVANLLRLLWRDEFDEDYFYESIGQLPIETDQIDASTALQLISEAYIGAKFDLAGLDAQILSVTDNGHSDWPYVDIEFNHNRDEVINKLEVLGYDESVIID